MLTRWKGTLVVVAVAKVRRPAQQPTAAGWTTGEPIDLCCARAHPSNETPARMESHCKLLSRLKRIPGRNEFGFACRDARAVLSRSDPTSLSPRPPWPRWVSAISLPVRRFTVMTIVSRHGIMVMAVFVGSIYFQRWRALRPQPLLPGLSRRRWGRRSRRMDLR